jgi:hypothetical protein
VTNCTFTSNTAGYGGGGMYINCDSTILNCIFVGNRANDNGMRGTGGGGGLYLYTQEFFMTTITNCIFINNTSSANGGGAYNYQGRLMMINCTFTGNKASSGGGLFGGYYNIATVAGMTNCILWNDSAPIGSEVYLLAGSLTFDHCDTQGGILGTNEGGNINHDPQFVNHANPMGPDGIWRTGDDGLELQSTSHCIHAGNPVGAPLFDILGNSRGNQPDMGAYQYVKPKPKAGLMDWLDYQ